VWGAEKTTEKQNWFLRPPREHTAFSEEFDLPMIVVVVGINIQNAHTTRLDLQVTAHHEKRKGGGV
jgi:hypothetical protein